MLAPAPRVKNPRARLEIIATPSQSYDFAGELGSSVIRNGSKLTVLLNQFAQRFIRVMIEKTLPTFALGLRQKLLLHFQCFYRVKVVAHDPGKRYMRAHRHKICETKQRLSLAIEPPT